MMLKGLTGVWTLVFLAAIIPGIYLQRNDSSARPAAELPSDPQSLPGCLVLQPHEAIPPIGAYTLRSHEGKPCIKATMGAEYIVIEAQKSWYFNLDPSRVRISGHCAKEDAVLSLTLPDNSASLQFTFRKDLKRFYVTRVSAHISPVCQKCPNKTYSGLLDHDKLFTTANGKSFMCKSENVLLMSSELRIKLVPLQMQAFTLSDGLFGKEVECWADFAKQVIPIIIGATVVGLLLITVLTFLFIKDRHRSGYNRI